MFIIFGKRDIIIFIRKRGYYYMRAIDDTILTQTQALS